MIFQSYALWPHMTVAQNVAYGLRFKPGLSKGERARRVTQMLRVVQLAGYEPRYPGELSGGQQQRSRWRARSRWSRRSSCSMSPNRCGSACHGSPARARRPWRFSEPGCRPRSVRSSHRRRRRRAAGIHGME